MCPACSDNQASQPFKAFLMPHGISCAVSQSERNHDWEPMIWRAFEMESSPAAQANAVKPLHALPEVRQKTSASADQHGSEIRPLYPSAIRTVTGDRIRQAVPHVLMG